MNQEFNNTYSVDKQILEQLSIAVLLIDSEGQVHYCNQIAAMLFGQSQKKLKTQNIWDLLVYNTFPAHLIEEVLNYDRSFTDSDVELIFPDGRHIVTEVSAHQALLNDKGYCLLQFRQNDNLRKINQENTQKHHISASRHLIRGLAHEIKNPLGGIRGAAQLLSRSLDSDELKEFTQLIIEQSDRLRDLVDRLLGPNTPPKQIASNIHVVLERVFSLISLDKDERIEVIKDYDPSLPTTVFDPNQVEQAVLNVVKNGIQALTEYMITRDSSYHPRLIIKTRFVGHKVLHNRRYKQTLKISVVDNGPGIDDELRSTIFYPLVTSKSDGNGLGLPISQTLIDQHKGTIEVESRPGLTEFNIFLPVIQESMGREK